MTNPGVTSQLSALGNRVAGSSWVVTYYSQILGADNAPSAHDVNKQAAFQQYRKISQFELMVTSPLTQQQDAETKEFSVTGTATVYSVLTPNDGDAFIADIDNGQRAVFNVTKSNKATYRKGSNYVIEYTLVEYVDGVLDADLDKKSVQQYTFVKDLLTSGQDPLMTTDQYALYYGLDALFLDLASMYYRDFFSVQRQTLLGPDQRCELYDAWLTKAMSDILSTDDTTRYPEVRQPAVNGDQAMLNVTVWDALIRTNKSYLITGIQRVGVVHTDNFRNLPWLAGIYFTGIGQLVYPKDARTDIDSEHQFVNHPNIHDYDNTGKMRYQDLERILTNEEEAFFQASCQCVEKDGQTILPPIVSVTQDDYYVFTKPFYQVQAVQLSSQLEVLARNAITGQTVDRSQLTSLGKLAFSWPNLERYYYIPVILALIRISQRSS